MHAMDLFSSGRPSRKIGMRIHVTVDREVQRIQFPSMNQLFIHAHFGLVNSTAIRRGVQSVQCIDCHPESARCDNHAFALQFHRPLASIDGTIAHGEQPNAPQLRIGLVGNFKLPKKWIQWLLR